MTPMRINSRFIRALVKRDLYKYFTNPTGYVFITLFIFISAAAAFWQDRFFLNNLANLDQLNSAFPYLLAFFIPALTMAVWSEERRQGTDELLLTLPATSLEVVLGKYLATLAIYTVSLVLSLSHTIVLFWLGSPDLGLIFGNYVGYWLIGAAMISLGMLASLLTANATIAFILGAAFCGVFTFLESMVGTFSTTLADWIAPLGVVGHFEDFARGVISFSGLVYFLSVSATMLYINTMLTERRHWPRRADGYPMWSHHMLRTAAIVIAVISLNAVIGRTALRLDVTAERLHSLSRETRSLIAELPDDRPVFIQAFISPEVPESLVQVRANLLGTLRELDSIAGAKAQVLVEDTEPFTDVARDAREKFGIVPREIPNLRNARFGFSEVFMGIAITCGAEEEVIPFLDRGLSPEYEITRSMRVVARTDRKRIGLVNTAAQIFGGFDFQSMRSNPPWPVVSELKKQYEVVQVAPDGPIAEDLDGLMVALPSSMSQEEMNNVVEYMEAGHPTLLLIDPLPVVNIGLAPAERAGANQNPFMQNQAPPPKEKGNIQQFLSRIGVRWDSTRIIWDNYNPHPDLAHLPPEVVFVGKGNQNENAINPDHRSSAGMQEMVFLYPGTIDEAATTANEFTPLLRSGPDSGNFSYFQVVQRTFLGVQLNRNLPHRPDGRDYVLAAHVKSAAEKKPEETSGEEDGHSGDSAGQEEIDPQAADQQPPGDEQSPSINVIVIADLDFISEQFFQIRASGPENLNFDNVTFFLNCIDVLIGDESFITLRSKRARHRTLERVEEQTSNFIDERVAKEQDAEAEADQALADAQRRLDDKVNEVRQRPDLDAQTKQIMARNLQEVEQRRFEVLKANIEAEKLAKINESKESMEGQIRRIQSNIKTSAVLLPPIPVFVIGVLIFVRRQRREREGAAAARRLRA